MAKRTLKNKTIEVILLQQDKYLWEKYEVVRVKPSYARNVLFPKNIAVFSSPMMLNQHKQKMNAAEQERVKKSKWLDELFMKVNEDWGISIAKKVNKEWGLYEKIDENDIVKAIAEKYGFEIEPYLFKLKKKIWAVWSYKIPFLYKEMKKELQLNISAEKSEKDEAQEKEAQEKQVKKIDKGKTDEVKEKKSAVNKTTTKKTKK